MSYTKREEDPHAGYITFVVSMILVFIIAMVFFANHYNNERVLFTHCQTISRNVNEFNACRNPSYYRTDGTTRGS